MHIQAFLSTLSLRRATLAANANKYYHGEFLSTLSLRRATRPVAQPPGHQGISIHALLAESDPRATTPAVIR